MDVSHPMDLSLTKQDVSTTCDPQIPKFRSFFPLPRAPLNPAYLYPITNVPFLVPQPWMPQYPPVNRPTISSPVHIESQAKSNPESVFHTPSASPGSSPEGFEHPEVHDKTKTTELKRRLSESSTHSSTCSNDKNNNEKVEVSQTVESTVESKEYSPEKKKSKPEFEGSLSPMDYNCNIKKESLIEQEQELSQSSSPTKSFTTETDYCDSSSNTKSRTTRPFKAITSGMIMKPLQYSGPIGDYETYRQTILSKINDSGKSTNQNMRRHGNSANLHITDPTYWEKRKRNNEAAKRSRDARRRKEDEVAIRCAFLEQERISFMKQIEMLNEEKERMQQQLIMYQQKCEMLSEVNKYHLGMLR